MDHPGDPGLRLLGGPLIAASDEDEQSGSERNRKSGTHAG
jgi:hypothetical protein